ncbi:MAG: hypothetical protein IPM81_03285 [Saprospirales bacterium]|nr:hypothetical protein [Saprospirales bacterium]
MKGDAFCNREAVEYALQYALQDLHIQPLRGYKIIFFSFPGLHPGLFMFNRFAVKKYAQKTLGSTEALNALNAGYTTYFWLFDIFL